MKQPLYRLAKLIKSSEGMSLTELLITCTLLVVVITAIYDLFYFTEHSWKASSAATNAQINARLGIDRLVKELRQAEEPADGSEKIPVANQNEVVFYLDTDSDSLAEKVHYFVNNSKLIKGVVDYSQQSGYTGNETQTEVAEYVTVLSFQYFDQSSQQITLPLDQSKRAQIKLVSVSIFADADPSSPPGAFEVESDARLRNFGASQ